ncbi:hypothetical protein [Porcine kirkovirus]|uniref:Uncharacterized protein n=1 Tax=Porcine kirkovirus TaxID=2876210 RepID=A0AAE9K3Z3_9VIRU|nr:hypothetical protein [Porcine kirkovirus]
MYNDSYYSRRGRTIQRKKIDNGHVINPSLVPVYYNYLRDNGMFPSAPAPPVHVDDGTCIAVEYNKQEYTFPSAYTPLANVLGTMLDSLGIDVDITTVDHIILSLSTTSTETHKRSLLFSRSVSDTTPPLFMIGSYYGDTAEQNSFTFTFVRDYSQSGNVFYVHMAEIRNVGDYSNVFYSSVSRPLYVKQYDNSHVYLNRVVVSSVTESL